MQAVHEEEYNGLVIRIFPDEDAANPRKKFDCFGVMACEHRRYNLGDGGLDLLADAIRASRYYRNTWEDEYREGCLDLSYPPDIATALDRCKDIIALPLYLYDHSGLVMNTTGFYCRWDSGQVGYVFTTLDAIRNEYGVSRVSSKTREKAVRLLVAEVETYSSYLEGDVYGYVVETAVKDEDGEALLDEEGEILDSRWGFYGLDYCLEQAKEAANYHANKAA